jgi:hypothetical protein
MLQNGLSQPELSVKDVDKQSPLIFILYLNAAILLLTSIHTWILSHIYFQETKNIILGVGRTLVAITTIVVLLIPSHISRRYFEKNLYEINFGAGRAWIYIGRITMPVLSFVILPCIVIVNNPKMRKALMRKLRDIIWSFNHN